MLEHLEFADFSDPVWMTPSVGPSFLFLENTLSRDDGVSHGVLSSTVIHIWCSSFAGM